MAAAVHSMTAAVHSAVPVLSRIRIWGRMAVLVLLAVLALGTVLMLGLLVRLVRILILWLSLAAESVHLLSDRLGILSSRLCHTGLASCLLLASLAVINLCPFIVVHKNSPFTTKLIYRKFFDLLVYVREFTRDL